MPGTREYNCMNDDCALDMFQAHYTYELSHDHSVSDLSCPLCEGTDCLKEIEL